MKKSAITSNDIWCSRQIMESPIYYGICTNEKMFRKQCRSIGIPVKDIPDYMANERADATVHFMEARKGRAAAIVCVSPNNKYTKLELYALLVHEATHIWQRIRRHICEDSPSDEFEAYSIQRISLELMSNYETQIKKCKK